MTVKTAMKIAPLSVSRFETSGEDSSTILSRRNQRPDFHSLHPRVLQRDGLPDHLGDSDPFGFRSNQQAMMAPTTILTLSFPHSYSWFSNDLRPQKATSLDFTQNVSYQSLTMPLLTYVPSHPNTSPPSCRNYYISCFYRLTKS